MYKIAAFMSFFLLCVPLVKAQVSGTRENKVQLLQGKVILNVITAGTSDRQILQKYNYHNSLPDSVEAVRAASQLVYKLQQDAYLLASADSILLRQDTLHVKLFIGQQFEWAQLRNGNLSEGILIESGFREKFYRDIPFKPSEFVKLQQRILDYAERNGYPFASVWLDSIIIKDNKVEAALMVEKAFVVTYDSLEIVGNTKTQPKFLMRYLQVLPGQIYNQDQINASQRMLTQLPYIKATRQPQVRFARDKAKVYYFLEDRQANQMDGIVGFLPDPSRKDKLLITGEANLNIRNIKGTGKQLGMQWRKVNKGSVILNGDYLHPNLFATPFEFETRFGLLKQDSSFITIRPRVQLAYNTLKYGKLSAFTEWRNSRILSTANTQSLLKLDLADARTNIYGLNYLWNNLDDYYFPRKGQLIELELSAGHKKLLRSSSLEKSFYDTLNIKTTQLGLGLRLENFLRVNKSSILFTRLNGRTVLSKQILLNDMFRIGGLNTLRGFDEYFFYASTYAVGTIEYRLFTAQDSYMLLFYDQGYYRSDLESSITSDFPLGFGGGISFSTGAGIFQLVYSLGKSELQPLSFKYSKIHFGITSKF